MRAAVYLRGSTAEQSTDNQLAAGARGQKKRPASIKSAPACSLSTKLQSS